MKHEKSVLETCFTHFVFPYKAKGKRKEGRGKEAFNKSFILLVFVNNYNFYPDNFVYHNVTTGHYH